MKEGWEIKKLGDVCEVQRGLTYSRKDAVDYSNTVVLRATNISLKNSCLDFDELKYLRDDFQIKDIYKLKKGSLLICFSSGSKSHLGKVALVDKQYDCAFGGFIGQINPNNEILSEYLFYSLISENYKTYMSELTDGVNINNLKTKDLQAYQIPIPPLPEQKRIVAKLDQCFETIDKACANVEKNLQSAKELFQSKLNEVFSQRGDGWVEKKLGEVCEVFNGFAFKSKDTVATSNTQLLRMGNLYQNKLDLNRKPVFYPDEFAIDYRDYLLEQNDLVMSLTGTAEKRDYGFTVRIPGTPLNILLNQRIMKISILDNEVLDKLFLHSFLLSPSFFEKLHSTAHGTRQGNLSSRTIVTLDISFPKSILEQKRIVNQLGELKSQTQSLESKYQQELDALDELKKSILQKAFEGEL